MTVLDGVYTLPFVVRTGGTIEVTIILTKDFYQTQQITYTFRSDFSAEQILAQNLALGGGFIFIFLAIAIIAYAKHFAIPWIIRQLNKMIAALAKGKVPSPVKVRSREDLVLEIINEELKPSTLEKELEDVPGPSIEAVTQQQNNHKEKCPGTGDLKMAEKTCGLCGEHSGFEAHIEHLCAYKKKLSDSGGTIERIWTALDSKIGEGLLITFTVLFLTLLGTLYGLTYRTQNQILSEMSAIKTDIAVIKEKVK